MLALALVVVIFCFWSLVGFAVVSNLRTHRNLLQNALLSPVTGSGATVLLVMALNWGLPVRYVGPTLTVFLLVSSMWLLRRRASPLPLRQLVPFAGVLLIAALVTG